MSLFIKLGVANIARKDHTCTRSSSGTYIQALLLLTTYNYTNVSLLFAVWEREHLEPLWLVGDSGGDFSLSRIVSGLLLALVER